MDQQTKAPATNGRPVVTLEIVKATFNKELTALKYQEIISRFTALPVTSENVTQVQDSIKWVRNFVKELGNVKEKGKKAALDECRMWDAAYNDVHGTINELLIEKSNALQKVVDAIDEENRKKEQERQRVDGIKKEITNFILNTSSEIAATTDTATLVAIEKKIGSHKGNESRYAEFITEMRDRCNELVPMIKKQKQHIKELDRIAKAKKKAEKAGDDRALEGLMQEETAVTDAIEGSKIEIQEAAINQATRPTEEAVVPESTDINFRRKQWKWDVKDVKELYKKMPHLVDLVPNKEKLDDLLRTKKTDGSLKDKEEVVVNGIRFYLSKLA